MSPEPCNVGREDPKFETARQEIMIEKIISDSIKKAEAVTRGKLAFAGLMLDQSVVGRSLLHVVVKDRSSEELLVFAGERFEKIFKISGYEPESNGTRIGHVSFENETISPGKGFYILELPAVFIGQDESGTGELRISDESGEKLKFGIVLLEGHYKGMSLDRQLRHLGSGDYSIFLTPLKRAGGLI